MHVKYIFVIDLDINKDDPLFFVHTRFTKQLRHSFSSLLPRISFFVEVRTFFPNTMICLKKNQNRGKIFSVYITILTHFFRYQFIKLRHKILFHPLIGLLQSSFVIIGLLHVHTVRLPGRPLHPHSLTWKLHCQQIKPFNLFFSSVLPVKANFKKSTSMLILKKEQC